MSEPTSTAANASGLTSSEAAKRLAEIGPNALAETRQVSPLRVLLRQFTNFLILVLLVAAGIAWLMGEVVDTIAILLVVLLNGVLGFVQEWRAETALAALRRMISPTARVVRDGRLRQIDSREIVPGDLVVLDSGDRVPADLSVTLDSGLRVDESVLTGESVPVSKSVSGDPRLFMGTSLVDGRAEGQVTATGPRTEFGRIATLTGSVGEKTTRLQLQLGGLARQLAIVAIALGVAIGLAGVATGRAAGEMFMTGLSLAVAMVPEGLPAVVTVTLALGASAMLRRNALVRRLQAVETLGAASVICTDKTGTLTENKMTVTGLWVAGRDYAVTGTGYDPTGHIEHDGQRIRAEDDRDLADALAVAAGCNNARLTCEGAVWHMLGDPTEGALMTLAFKGWSPPPESSALLSENPFSSDRKRMSTVRRTASGVMLRAKGAPEAIFDVCATVRTENGAHPLTDDLRAEIEARYHAMAETGQRVIALAQRATTPDDAREEDLEFLGLAGLIDPPRPEVAAAVAACQSAGVRVIMITGDSPVTASAIAGAVGVAVDRVIPGAELEGIDQTALAEALAHNVIFARTAPAQKMRIVEALQARGSIIAMTGDGVNDAPALKRADIGVAMGVRGTDVAKDSADIVLLDDNFATIVGAVREGRRQFANVQKFVRYLLSSNAGEVVAILVNILIGGPLIFLASQILWMNLVTDGATAVALGLEKGTPGQMRRPPRPARTPIVGRAGLVMIVTLGLYTGGASLWVFYSLLELGDVYARTAAFTAMVVFEKASVFAYRSFSLPNWKIGLSSNPVLLAALTVTLGLQVAAVYWGPLQTLLRTVPLDWAAWQAILLLTLPILIVPELLKTFRSAR